MNSLVTDTVFNWIDNNAVPAADEKTFNKINPATGEILCQVSRSSEKDASAAIASAKMAQPGWASTTPVRRAEILREISIIMRNRQDDLARIVHLETGKSIKDALGEVGAAIEQGFFMAGEGRRFYGKTTTSGMEERTAMTIRVPVGISVLIIAANTPIANVAWKVFPALICGNSAILKPSEDSPMVAWAFAQLAKEAGLPDGVLNIINGYGQEAGAPLVENREVDLVSFTGCTATGRTIAQATSKRLAKVFLELGGKNPLVVCDDADLDNACKWTILSAFSNAGQRCAAASRIIIFDSVYDKFKDMLIKAAEKITVGIEDSNDLGCVINENQLNKMINAVAKSEREGAKVLIGGKRSIAANNSGGYFMEPTLIENVSASADISQKELFGPIATLYRVSGFDEAVDLANDSEYGLTSCIHTKNINMAIEFTRRMKSGVVNVNAGTYGSEPHMPFGGVKNSGNGLREPGTEALDVYCEWKNININILPAK
ncbi:MAG TPA: aldehyde dehydrogenase [Nitrospirae bacterium]|nr:aldehyde dehydrogenase [Nitrospirota bacterium]